MTRHLLFSPLYKSIGRVLLCSVLVATGLMVSAAQRQVATTVAAASGAIVVEPIPASTLWVGSLDPAVTTDAEVTNLIYAGLLKQAYDSRQGHFTIIPDLAEQLPSVSKDGRVYTFHIRPDARFSDGTPVTAQDFVYSYRRVLDPKTNSWASYYLYDILGAADFNAGKTTTLKGVKALNDHTLQITLWHAASYFLYALTYATGSVVKQTLKISAPVSTDPSLVIGAGPWKLKNQTWTYRRSIALVPNPYYHDAKHFKISELDLVFTGSIDTNFFGYKSGQFPITWLPSAEVSHYRSTPAFKATPTLAYYWYAMNVKVAPFTNIHFRRAVAYAINRDALANGVDHGTVQPLYCWFPKGLIGYRTDCQSTFPSYNPARAKKELALAHLSSIPPITLEYESENSDRKREAQAVQADLHAIGITLHLHPAPRATWLKDGFSGKVPFIEEDWVPDYPDPQDFADYLLKTGAGSNWAQYSNPRVDALLTRADSETNLIARTQLYEQAQAIFLNDAPVAMAFQVAAQDLISPRYHGLEINPLWANYIQPVGNDWANVTVSS